MDVIEQLKEARAYHLNEVTRIDIAISVFKDSGRIARKAGVAVAKTRARVAGEPAIGKRKTTKAARAAHALRQRAYYAQKKTKRTTAVVPPRTQKKTSYAQMKALREAAKRPVDLVRRVFLDAGSGVALSAQVIADRIGIVKEPNDRKMLGVVLGGMRKRKEIQGTHSGAFIARKLRPINGTALGADGQ